MLKPSSSVLAFVALILLSLFAFTYLGWWGRILENPETAQLPYYIFRTMLRMIAAYILVIIFGLVYGITAALYQKPRVFMIPLLDILQSIPVLGYLPAAVLLFIGAFPGQLGTEFASILLIFTGMAWAVTFGVYGAVRNIPNDLREASNAFGVRGLMYIRHVVLPIIFPAFITGSILAWGGGWYFLVAAEFMSFGRHLASGAVLPQCISGTDPSVCSLSLPGIGEYLARAIFVTHNTPSAVFGLVVFSTLVFAINILVWKPLTFYSRRFRLETMSSPSPFDSGGSDRSPIILAFDWIRPHLSVIDDVLFRLTSTFSSLTRRGRFGNAFSFLYVPRRKRPFKPGILSLGPIYIVLFIIVMVLFGSFVASAIPSAIQVPIQDIQNSFKLHPEAYNLPIYALDSVVRIAFAYFIALGWTLAVAIIICRSKRLYDILMPLFDIGQSIPALALFPFIVVFVITFFGGGSFGVEVASILLLLTGTQWYLLFNLLSAIRSIPGDILEASRSFGLKGLSFYWHILLPAIFPGIIIGSVQAWGGAWNATIVSEYINYNGTVTSVPGLGSFLTQATLWGDPALVTIAVGVMVLVILIMNSLIWRVLFERAERYKFEST